MFNVSVLQLLFGSKPLVLHLVERQRILLLSAYFFGEEAKKNTTLILGLLFTVLFTNFVRSRLFLSSERWPQSEWSVLC